MLEHRRCEVLDRPAADLHDEVVVAGNDGKAEHPFHGAYRAHHVARRSGRGADEDEPVDVPASER